MMKVLTVIGARPQFIKAGVVSAELAKYPDVDEIVVHTGQHFDSNMSDVFFSELRMCLPKYVLDIHGGTHGEMTARMLQRIEDVLLSERPDLVLVYGDTNSTLAGALAAVKLHIPVAHVEAGLRSFNRRMPEEVNRILTDRISTWLFAPTTDAVNHLLREGMDRASIHLVGDVMFDAALKYGAQSISSNTDLVKKLGLYDTKYVLTTVHRAENTDDPRRIRVIAEALNFVAQKYSVVWPLHPRTRNQLEKNGLLSSLSDAIKLLEPVGYMGMVQLERGSAVIATDSGGVQKEAFFHRVPCVTLRDETEWGELVESGWNRLVSPVDSEQVASTILKAVGAAGTAIAPYGDGDTAQKIVAQLLRSVG